jgi:hypothetical protein
MNLDCFDVIVLGAGPAGLVAAMSSVTDNLRVAIIDAPDLNLRNVDSQTTIPKVELYSNVGGNTRYWGGQIAYFSIDELHTFVESAGISLNEVEKLQNEMREVAKSLGLAFDLENKYYDIFQEKYIFNFKHVYSTYVKSLDITKLFGIQNLLKRQTIELIQGKVKKLSIYDGRCTGILMSDENYLKVNSNQAVFIALGAIGSTELLMRSLPEVASKFLHPMVDHPHGYVAAFKTKRASDVYRRTHFKVDSKSFKRKFLMKSTDTKSAGIAELHYEFYEHSFPNITRVPLNKFEAVMQLLNRFSLKFFRVPISRPRLIWVWVQIEQLPSSRNLPRFGKNNVIEFPFGLSEMDLKLIEEFQSILITEIESAGLELVWRADSEYVANHFEGAYHPSGSLPMNINSEISLVAPYGSFKQVQNLFIASSATWPKPSWVNPTFMLIIFAKFVYREMRQKLFE